jgi:hypothetical protein
MIGSRVMGLWSNGRWYPGKVTQQRDRGGERQFFVQFDDGDTAWLEPGQIQVQGGAPSTASTSTSAPAARGLVPFPGARVMGDWTEDSWYPGYVAEANANETLFFVQFDDGDTKWLSPIKIRPHGDRPNAAPAPHLTPGAVVQGEWSEGSWYPGVVARVNNNSTLFFIQFDDGDTKWLPVHQLRFAAVAHAPAPPPAYAPAPAAHAPPGMPAHAAPAAYAPPPAAAPVEARCAYCNTRVTGADRARCGECGAKL